MTPDSQRPKHIEAKINFLKTEDGGRQTAVTSGYRPQFHYEGEDWDAIQTYPDVDWVQPGDMVRAFLRFTKPDAHRGRIFHGMTFEVREGPNVVARGVVTGILDL
jgi:translation elongation factor EF-Tu-like GTPase